MSYIEAILANRPGAKCRVNEMTGEIMVWKGPGKQPTMEEVIAWKAAEAEKPKALSLDEKVEILWAEHEKKK